MMNLDIISRWGKIQVIKWVIISRLGVVNRGGNKAKLVKELKIRGRGMRNRKKRGIEK
jgi:hypothetical protein